ncbi:LysR substrate-binding domain-containing protein [Paraburkholderia nemoris]|uniref:LysR substrate-binding domain-containing protein n=1 Tax=Paraburkholderia TaxID=1822464 RepID=UPI0038BD3F0D
MNTLQQRLKLRHISVVLEISRCGSLQKAAEALALSHSAISKALAEVEVLTGGQLFERTSTGVRPTVLGEALVRHGYLIASDVQRAEAELDALRHGDMGTLSIGIFFPLNWWSVLADCVGDFRTRLPGIRLKVREDSMESLLERLDQDLIDIVIGRMASGFGGDQYLHEPLCEDHPLFVARQGHPLTQKQVSLEDLLGFPWFLPEQPNIIRQQLEYAVRDMGLRFGVDVMSSQVSPLTFRLASSSDTLVLASECIAKELDVLYRLQPVNCKLPLHLGPLAAVIRRDKPLSKAASTFLHQLQNAPSVRLRAGGYTPAA